MLLKNLYSYFYQFSMKRRFIEFIFRMFVYFRRAHGTYFTFIIQFVNFITITYTLLLVNILHFPNIFTYFIIYATLFILIYVPLCIFIGWIDMKKGMFPIESKTIWIHNPIVQEIRKDLETIKQVLYYLSIGENEKAREILEKYVKR